MQVILAMSSMNSSTFLNVLVLVEWLQSIVLGEPTERVDQVGAQVWIDILGRELGRTWPVDRPVRVIADDLSLGITWTHRSNRIIVSKIDRASTTLILLLEDISPMLNFKLFPGLAVRS